MREQTLLELLERTFYVAEDGLDYLSTMSEFEMEGEEYEKGFSELKDVIIELNRCGLSINHSSIFDIE